MVTLRQIDGFLAAAETLSFSRAAQKLHVTQSAFSQLVRDMESALDVRLFDRTTRRVDLTDAGRALLPKMRSAVLVIKEACQEATAISRLEKGHVSVGALSSLACACVTPALGDLRRSYPGVTSSLYENHNPDLLNMVLEAKVEFAVCAQTQAATDLVFEQLLVEEVVAVVPAGHPLAGKSRQIWKKVGAEPLIMMTHHSSTRRAIADALEVNGIGDNPDYEVATLATAFSMVRSGFGIALMPMIGLLEMHKEGLAICRMVHPTATRTIAICHRRDRIPTAAALQLVQLVKTRVKKLSHPGIVQLGN